MTSSRAEAPGPALRVVLGLPLRPTALPVGRLYKMTDGIPPVLTDPDPDRPDFVSNPSGRLAPANPDPAYPCGVRAPLVSELDPFT